MVIKQLITGPVWFKIHTRAKHLIKELKGQEFSSMMNFSNSGLQSGFHCDPRAGQNTMEVFPEVAPAPAALVARTGVYNEQALQADMKSIWIGNVDYNATAQQLVDYFSSCGIVERVTIQCNKFTGRPKGFAYMEFNKPNSVESALSLNGTLFCGRTIQVMPKRSNVPGISTTDRHSKKQFHQMKTVRKLDFGNAVQNPGFVQPFIGHGPSGHVPQNSGMQLVALNGNTAGVPFVHGSC